MRPRSCRHLAASCDQWRPAPKVDKWIFIKTHKFIGLSCISTNFSFQNINNLKKKLICTTTINFIVNKFTNLIYYYVFLTFYYREHILFIIAYSKTYFDLLFNTES